MFRVLNKSYIIMENVNKLNLDETKIENHEALSEGPKELNFGLKIR